MISVGKPNRKTSLVERTRGWEYNANMELKERDVMEFMDWINMALDRDQWRILVNMVIKLRIL
jgi:hypothetical protein